MPLLPASIRASESLSVISDLAEQEMSDLRSLAQVLRVMDIDRVPAVLLPYLAWQFRVEGFDDQLPDHLQREQIKNALQVHRYKGTRFAVETGLQNLGVAADIVEWWESTPEGVPHTFEVTAWANSNIGRAEGEAILTAALQEGVRNMIERTKPLRSKFTMRVGAKFASCLAAGANVRAATMLRQSAKAMHEPALLSGVRVGGRVAAATMVRATMVAAA